MASSDNKGMQFFITTLVFLLIFFGFYYFITNRDKKGETTNADFEAAYINDGAAFISGIKAENPKKIAVAERIAFSNAAGDGVYYIDNYAKLKYYDIATGDSRDVFINVGAFTVSPSGELIAVTERGESGRLKVITPAGETVADLGTGEKPSWFIEGQRLAFIAGTTVFDAAGGDWNARPLYAGNPTDIAVSPDEKTILVCERDDAGSRLALLNIATKGVSEIKKAAADEAAEGPAPLGFSGPNWLDKTNEALFIYNDAKGGRVYRYNADTGEVAGVVEEPGPIYSLAVSSKGDRAAYFYIVSANLPKFTEKVDGKDVPMVFGPADMTQAYIEDLYKRGKDGEIGGEKLNNLNTRRLLDGDVIRIVDLTKGTYWPLGSGQYPVLR